MPRTIASLLALRYRSADAVTAIEFSRNPAMHESRLAGFIIDVGHGSAHRPESLNRYPCPPIAWLRLPATLQKSGPAALDDTAPEKPQLLGKLPLVPRLDWHRRQSCATLNGMIWVMAHYRRLQSLLRRRGRTHEEAEDLIQETFLRVKIYLDQGNEIREPEAFLVRTALNLSKDTRLHERRHLYAHKSVEDMFLADSGPSPDEVFEAEQRLRQLKAVLDAASRRTREVFLMQRLYGMTYEQIADHFDVSVSAIEKHIAKAWSILGREVLRNDAE